MFKNKALKVTVIGKEDGVAEESVTFDASETIEKAGEVIKDISRELGSLVLVYIAADTVRKILIEFAKK